MLEEMNKRAEERMGDLPEKLEDCYRLEFTFTNGNVTCWKKVKNVTITGKHIWFDVEREDRWNRVCVNTDKINFVEFMGKSED